MNHRSQKHVLKRILVHVGQDPLATDGVFAATLEDGTHLSAEALRRVTCDSGMVGRIGLELARTNGTKARIDDLRAIEQRLDLGTGVVTFPYTQGLAPPPIRNGGIDQQVMRRTLEAAAASRLKATPSTIT